MKYSRNAVYSRVESVIKTAYPNVECTSRKVAKPSGYPNVWIHEIDNFRPQQFTQIDGQDEQWESAFEVQVISNRAGTAMSEAYQIMSAAVQAFNSLYYRKFSENTVDTGDTFTVIARFRRRIGGGDVFPPTNE